MKNIMAVVKEYSEDRRELIRELEETSPKVRSYSTRLEAIMDFNIAHQDGRQLLDSLESYLNNGIENFTKEEYNHINRIQGPGYEKLLTMAMKRGEVSREMVLKINNKLNQRMSDQYSIITKRPLKKKMTNSYEQWIRADERDKTLRKVIDRQNKMIINAKKEKPKGMIRRFLERKGGWTRV